MVDQCGFKNDNGDYLTEYDYNDEFQTNSVRRYTRHGEWVEPVFPAVRTLQDSVPTPYIFDDIVDYKECAEAIYYWWMMNDEDRVEAGKLGYCQMYKFKCASERTCDSWVTGGPIKSDNEKKGK